MSDTPENNSKTGYGKPPVHSQFKKGQSGNPAGRPKSRVSNMLAQIMDQTIERRGYKWTRLEYSLTKLAWKAEDDPAYMRLLLNELRQRDILMKPADDDSEPVEEPVSNIEELESEAVSQSPAENAGETPSELVEETVSNIEELEGEGDAELPAENSDESTSE